MKSQARESYVQTYKEGSGKLEEIVFEKTVTELNEFRAQVDLDIAFLEGQIETLCANEKAGKK